MKLKMIICMRHTATLALLISLLIVAFVFLPQPNVYAESAADSWPMYHNDPAHTGYSNGTAPTNSPMQLWNYTIDISALSSSPSPVVADGFVYVGSGDYNIYCFDAATGATVWSFPTGNLADSTPAVADGRVYAGSGDGYVYCLDASNGAQIWNFSIRGPSDDSADAPISFVDGRVFVESWSGNVFCLDAASGNRIWNYSTGSNSYGSSPAVAGSYVYVGTGVGGVFCLDASSGSKIWNYTTGGAVHSPTVANGYVYLGSADGNAYCLNASSGEKIWNYTTEYNSNGPSHGYHWGNIVSDPAVANGNVYVGSSDFLVYCLDASSGNQIWNYTTGAEVYAAPSVAGGCVFAGSYDGNVYCLNASIGSQIWNYAAGVFSPTNAGGSAGSPAIAGGTLYVVGDGAVYALGVSSTQPFSSLPTILIVAVTLALVIVVIALAFVYRKLKKGKKSGS